jgi:hypothetical protein
MANAPNYSSIAPIVNAGGISGSGNYSNVTLTGGAGLTYTTATGTNWSTAISDPYYTKKPKVKISDEDIEIDGLSLKETMLAVKNELMIPNRINRNDELEREFAELKEWADRYQELERKFLEQKKMWETLKKTD